MYVAEESLSNCTLALKGNVLGKPTPYWADGAEIIMPHWSTFINPMSFILKPAKYREVFWGEGVNL